MQFSIDKIAKLITSRIVGRAELCKKVDELKILQAKSLINEILNKGILKHIQEAEFKVFSQFGDDGIIQYLINNIKIDSRSFVEFGVENYREANTRFLLINNNWHGLVMDSSHKNINKIKDDDIYWRHDLTAVNIFINKDNINKVLKANGFAGEIGLLHIDIDGNDYWVWESLGVSNPEIVIIEYNSIFGSKWAVAVPYNPNFIRTKAHYSNLYWGSSLKAMIILGAKKGYRFIGSNSAGNNAYFVRNDKIGNLRVKTIEDGYTESKYRESRDEKGNLTYVSGKDRLRSIKHLEIFDIENSKMLKLGELIT